MEPDHVHRVYLRLYRDGESLAASLRGQGLCRSAFYEWRAGHPELDEQIREEARAQALVEVEEDRVRSARLREHIQLELLAGVAPVLAALAEDAAETDNVHIRIAALRELRQWLSDSALQPPSSAAEPPPQLPAGSSLALPDFLSGGLARLEVEAVSGDKIVMEKGQTIEGESQVID